MSATILSVQRMTCTRCRFANLDGEYATVLSTKQVLKTFDRRDRNDAIEPR